LPSAIVHGILAIVFFGWSTQYLLMEKRCDHGVIDINFICRLGDTSERDVLIRAEMLRPITMTFPAILQYPLLLWR